MKFKLWLFFPLFSFSLFSSFQAMAHEGHAEHEVKLALEITDLRIKAPIPGQIISAGYMNVRNQTDEEVSIVRVSSRSASKIEMHTHNTQDGMMMMQKLDLVDVPAGGTVNFKEGGYHLMVFDPDAEAVKAGTLRLVFELSDGYVIPVMGKVEHLMPSIPQTESSDVQHQHH